MTDPSDVHIRAVIYGSDKWRVQAEAGGRTTSWPQNTTITLAAVAAEFADLPPVHPEGIWVNEDDAWWGPFRGPPEAEAFAAFITQELHQARVVHGRPADDGVVFDPVLELLAWRREFLHTTITDPDSASAQAEAALAVEQRTEVQPGV
jgi:hypothetical protein